MMAGSRRTERLILAAMALCSVLLTVKYFPGVENSQYYAGLSLQAIHPEMLANDPAHGRPLSLSDTPYKLTAYYLLPRLFGEIWLDDRFILPLYLAMVFACFLAVDRIARLFGLSGPVERLAVLLLFMKDHQLLANKVIFAHDPDFHHSALSLPLSLWLLYIGLSGGGLVPLLAVGGVLAVVSLQVTPVNGILALAMLAVGATAARRRTVGIMLVLGIAALAVAMATVLAPPAADRPELWRLLTTKWFKNMADPFDTVRDGVAASVAYNGLFVALGLGAMLWKRPSEVAFRRLRLLAGAALGLWLAAGLYVHFAPPWMQQPQLLLFPFARQLQAVQAVLYVGLVALVFRRAEAQGGGRGGVAAGLTVLALMVAGPGNHLSWAALLGGGALLTAVAVRWRGGGAALAGWNGQRLVIAGALAVAVAVASAQAARQRLPDFVHLARTGIHGASSQAKWREVAGHLRRHTPPGAVLLPLAPREDSSRLIVVRELASRSGRAVALPFLLQRGLKLDEFRRVLEQRDIAFGIADAWSDGDRAAALAGLERLRPAVDYLVVPAGSAGRIAGPGFPFAAETTLGGWTVLRRVMGQGTALPEAPGRERTGDRR